MPDLGPRFEAVALLERLGYNGSWEDILGSGEWAGHERWAGATSRGLGGEVIGSREAVARVTFTFPLADITMGEFARLSHDVLDYFAVGASTWLVARLTDMEAATFELERSRADRRVVAKGFRVGSTAYLVTVFIEAEGEEAPLHDA